MQAEFSGVGLDPAAAAAYIPTLKNREAIRSSIGPVSLRGNAKGSHVSPCIRASVEAPRYVLTVEFSFLTKPDISRKRKAIQNHNHLNATTDRRVNT